MPFPLWFLYGTRGHTPTVKDQIFEKLHFVEHLPPLLADYFKGQQLVIVNLRNVDRELWKLIVDFCAGLTYALGGAVWPIDDRVFLLAPPDIEVLDEKGKQAGKRVFFNQL